MSVIISDPITQDDSFMEELIPEGWYNVEITKCQQASIPSGKGLLRISVRITTGKLKGTIKNLSFWIYKGNSEDAINFNRAMLFRLSKACGVIKLTNTNQIEGKKLRIKFDESEWEGNPRNEMKGFMPFVEEDEEEAEEEIEVEVEVAKPKAATQTIKTCLLYTSPSPRDS